MDFMEPLTPMGTQTPEVEKGKQEVTFSKKSNKNNIFNISIKNLQSYILLSAKVKIYFNYIIFEKKYYYDELRKNKYFCIFDSIDEIYEQLIVELKKESFKVNEEENKLKIIIPIEGIIKVKEIYSFGFGLYVLN